jgi:hypothetical protein
MSSSNGIIRPPFKNESERKFENDRETDNYVSHRALNKTSLGALLSTTAFIFS